ncbi:DUF5693 family protein [Halanaerobium salsuginis]|uniref:Uncharacterized protein n=1 Tax=Halanaerobium salsuginis TaxID=29563 RepID=A0A1I4FQJ7_9FIRM|nr:DUF5693 family protein [Halanaerobium salsuginis]SFL19086.1 hypothetical protein SAMN02983006_00439 [Halanaerobium salsuginis]
MKKILLLIIIITLIFAGAGLKARVNYFAQQKGIEIVFDGDSYLELKSLVPQLTMQKLQEAGVTGFAVYQQTLKDLLENGSLQKIDQINFAFLQQELRTKLQASNLDLQQSANTALFMAVNPNLIEQLKNLAPELEADYQVHSFEIADQYFLYFPHWHKTLENLSLGYNQHLVDQAQKAGLKIAYRSGNKLNAFAVLKNSIAAIKPQLLIFDGDEVTGYPADLRKTAELIKQNKLIYGNIEAFIADQSGADKLTKLTNFKLLRTHSMQQEEVEKSTKAKIIERYLLAVRERAVKIIYHKPFLKGDKLLERNLDLLNSLESDLKTAGYQIGQARPLGYFNSSRLNLVFVLFGVTAAGILLLYYFVGCRYLKALTLFFLATGLMALVLINLDKIILLRQIIAFAAAIIFPSLAIIAFLLNNKAGVADLKKDKLVFLIFNYTAAFLTALAGAIFVSAALNTSDFIFKVNNFRGIKLAFLLPLVLISFYFIVQPAKHNFTGKLPLLLEKNIKVKHLILAAGLALLAVIYIGRTGNFPLLPVPAWELTIRSLLAKILYVRPRFKEFLIGYPLLIFALYLNGEQKKKLIFYPLLMLASVGVITTVNTFSHLHTPVLISLFRTFHSYWLALIIGSLLILFYKVLLKLWHKYSYLFKAAN